MSQMSPHELNKMRSRFSHYLRLLQLISLLPADASPKWISKQCSWVTQAKQLAILIGRDFDTDLANFVDVISDAVQLEVDVNKVVGRAPHWTKPPSPYSPRARSPLGCVVGPRARRGEVLEALDTSN